MASLKICYLSHGLHKTGGAIYESILIDNLQNELRKRDKPSYCIHNSYNRTYRNLQNLSLFIRAFIDASGKINVTVLRTALSSMLRSLFSKNKTLIVLHNFDPADYKSVLLKAYSALLFQVLKTRRVSAWAIITVSPYWENFFKTKFPAANIFMIPNLFATHQYTAFHNRPRQKKIHLGQFSLKNDRAIFQLAEKLTDKGYHCYFTSLVPAEAGDYKHYSVRVTSFEEYLGEMAESLYTLALTYVNEGWNRIAHESLLTGTPVIGYDKGGLGDLLTESCSIIVSNADEAYHFIINHETPPLVSLPPGFIEKYDSRHAGEYLSALTDFIIQE